MNNGTCEGEVCGRAACVGVIDRHEVEKCSCHISPPCSACVDTQNFCPECDWEEADEPEAPVTANTAPAPDYSAMWKPRTLADLDRTRIDWISKSHSSCSMIKEGVFPIGTPVEDVRKAVNGTFGGSFEYLDEDHGNFKFIAYTD
jgi:hypothetical protein